MRFLPPPGARRNRQMVLLGVMLVVLALFLWRQMGSDPAAPVTATSNPQTTARPPVTAVGAANLPQPIELAKVGGPVSDEPDSGRNLFRFGQRPAPPAPPPPKPTAPPPVAPPPQVPPGPPPITLRLVGLSVAGNGCAMATLRDARGSVFVGCEGAVLDGQYKILKVGTQSVIVSYVDGQGQRTIGLGS
jgi:hypothetical protein